MKNSCFTLDVPRFLGLFEARPVIFTYHMTCYSYIFYRSSCILEDNSKTLDGFRGIASFLFFLTQFIVDITLIHVTPHHQMRHKWHTKVLSKWQNKEK